MFFAVSGGIGQYESSILPAPSSWNVEGGSRRQVSTSKPLLSPFFINFMVLLH